MNDWVWGFFQSIGFDYEKWAFKYFVFFIIGESIPLKVYFSTILFPSRVLFEASWIPQSLILVTLSVFVHQFFPMALIWMMELWCFSGTSGKVLLIQKDRWLLYSIRLNDLFYLFFQMSMFLFFHSSLRSLTFFCEYSQFACLLTAMPRVWAVGSNGQYFWVLIFCHLTLDF